MHVRSGEGGGLSPPAGKAHTPAAVHIPAAPELLTHMLPAALVLPTTVQVGVALALPWTQTAWSRARLSSST